MSVTIKTHKLSVRKPGTNQFDGLDMISDTSSTELVSRLTAEADRISATWPPEATECVQVNAQEFNSTMQAQARTNISAASIDEVNAITEEIEDARIDAESNSYTSLGESIRGQINNVKVQQENVQQQLNTASEIIKNNVDNVNLLDFSTAGSTTHNGVTFTKNNDGSWTVVGTANAQGAWVNFYYSTTELPWWLKAAESYYLDYTTNIEGTRFACYSYATTGTSTRTVNRYTNGQITPVLTGDVGAIIRLWVQANKTVNETVYPKMYKLRGNIINKEASFVSVGNSILTGAVYFEGNDSNKPNLLASYDNAPYGIIAKSLGIPQDKVAHTLISDNGLLPSTKGNGFKYAIMNESSTIDLTHVDYLVTHFFSNDMNYWLGTIDATPNEHVPTAEEIEALEENETLLEKYYLKDWTLAGQVLNLLEYIRSKNSRCQFILISVPPTHTNAALSGENVFTGLYTNNYSLHDLNVLMHKLAEKYNFIYIDYEDMELSYHYHDYTAEGNVHLNTEASYRMMGEYIASKIQQAQKVQKENILSECDKHIKTAYVNSNLTVLENTIDGEFTNIDVTGLNTGDIIRTSNKNLFEFTQSWDTMTRNGITFTVDREVGSISISSPEDVTAETTANKDPDTECLSPDYGFRCLSYIKFPQDTLITFTSNRNTQIEWQDQARMYIFYKIDNQDYTISDYGQGISLVCKANVEYLFNLKIYPKTKTHSVFNTTESGPIVFYPQIELGSHATSFVPHQGEIITYNDVINNNNLFQLNKTSHISRWAEQTIEILFRADTNQFLINTTVPLEGERKIIYDKNSEMSTINSQNAGSFAKFKITEPTMLYIDDGVPEEYQDYIHMQIFTGFKGGSKEFSSHKFTYRAVPIASQVNGTEFGIRYWLEPGIKYTNVKISPKIYTGIAGLKTHAPETILISSSGTNFKANYQISDIITPQIETPYINKLTKIHSPKTLYKPMITFIDDDTTSLSLVNDYHRVISSVTNRLNKDVELASILKKPVKVVGNYAVITRRLTDNPNIVEALLNYEREGYGMLFHCVTQSNADYFYNNASRDLQAIRENLIDGIRDMAQFGFTNYNYWISPYGVNDLDVQNIARELGFECLISNTTNNFIRPDGSTSRFNIPRVPLGISEVEVEKEGGGTETIYVADTTIRKQIIENAAASNGWVIITTHINTWKDDDGDADITSAMQKGGEDGIFELAKCAIQNGMEIVNFQHAFNLLKPMFYTTETLSNLLADN